ncbi:RTC4-like domain-containing protein [Radiomyces spectabilis]|uniref:RTC4-like domain-containing protein n=1 Tax=Radiomyces spectabilis TaxID=64574 RepID=UPI00221F8BAE|nr:RTC4-like domain-containing protein [Radiomyces spectabilis]KAI8381202.1 RTC4-like domain-containing protein [Radiomyces spectabilis]
MEQDVYTRTTFLIKKGNIPRKEQESFCHLHKIEITVKPEGRQKGYPSFIDFDQLKGRIHRMRNELEAVILGQEHSPYRNIALKAYETLGKNKARSTMGVMQRFDATLPGYYGPKGASIILRELQKLFINTNYLTKDMTKPQLPLEYMQQVLLPEVGYRLIKQDLTDRQSSNDGRDITQQAMDVMQESTEYGNMMYPDAHEPSAHEDKDDDDGDQDDQSEASFDSSAED